MCKNIYSPEVMIDAIELGKQIGMLKASQKLNIPYTTVANWKRIYNHPDAFPSHAITKHYTSLSSSKTEITPDKIELKAENESVDIELKVAVKPDVTKEIKGSYEQLRNNSRSYMPEFRAFAVALANKIGEKEAAAELGLKNSQIAHWIGDAKWQTSQEELKKQREGDWTRKRSEKLKTLQEENDKLRQYISNNIITSILQK